MVQSRPAPAAARTGSVQQVQGDFLASHLYRDGVIIKDLVGGRAQFQHVPPCA